MESLIQFGAHKLSLRSGATAEERKQRARWMLSRVFNLRSGIAFIGGGCSRAFGYPSWHELATSLVERTIEVLRNGESGTEAHLGVFQTYHNALNASGVTSPASLMFYISACQDILKERAGEHYADYFESAFSKPKTPNPRSNVYRAILKLPINRFVTTNYDCEIEKALGTSRSRPISWEDFGIPTSADGSVPPRSDDGLSLSFTQEDCYHRELARFAFTRLWQNRNMVFHCHGRWDRIDSIIASEADYQRWYLADRGDGAGHTFRQTIELLLHSNPLLFIGYGLEDEDLLRPLRYLGAVSPDRKASRPVFALLPSEPGKEQDFHYQEFLFARYGVHVIPFPRPDDDTDNNAWAEQLTQALADLNRLRKESIDQWVQKPLARKPQARSPRSGRHCLTLGLDLSRADLVALSAPDHSEVVLEALRQGPRVLGLIGPGGAGKSITLARAIQKLRGSRPARLSRLFSSSPSFSKIFLWNANNENEALTGLDLALDFLDPKRMTKGSRHKRLLACLREQKVLLILDGCERLLGTGAESQAEAMNLNTGRLFKILADPESQSTAIVAGRVWPRDLERLEGAEPDRVKRIAVVPATSNELMSVEIFRKLAGTREGQESASALCSLLDGHSYGLLLAARLLDRRQNQGLVGEAKKLHRYLADEPPKRRVFAMIRRTLEDLGSRTDGMGKELLERLAFFRSPVFEDTAKICWEEAKRAVRNSEVGSRRGRAEESLDVLLEQLVSDNLLFPATDATVPGSRAYLVHDAIANYFGRTGHGGQPQALPSFAQPGSTGVSSGIEPGSPEREKTIEHLFNRIHEAALDAIGNRERPASAVLLCRNAFGLMRSQMECDSVPRWGNYDRYTRYGIQVAELAKRISPKSWTFGTRLEIEQIEHPDAALYIAELAWLYSDVGLTLFSEGLMADAFSVWEQAYEINRVLEGAERPGEPVADSLLNLSHSLIDLGRIQDAEDYLDDADEINHWLGRPDDLQARIAGLRGLISHLKGNLERADSLYRDCLRYLATAGNPGPASFFWLHWSLLCLERDDLERAKQYARSARAYAEDAQRLDLLAYARVAEGDLLAKSNRIPMARQEYEWALKESRRFGARKIAAVVALKLSELALTQGDSEGARRQAMRCLVLSNELSLVLVQTRGLIALGRATIESGNAPLGQEYLQLAKDQAKDQKYWLRLREAERAGQATFPTCP